LTKLPGRGAKGALASHCQEDSEIAPLCSAHPPSPNRYAWTSCSIFNFHADRKWPSCSSRARSAAMMSTATMQAAVLEHHEGPFRLASVSRPVPGPGQALVRIAASAVNPLDIKIRAGAAAHARHPLPAILGLDLAGTIEATGEAVTRFRHGD